MQRYPLIVIGAGAAGLVVALGAAKAGKKVLLIEKGHWGGDCTNFGCIPSKSLIASAHAAHALSESDRMGVNAGSTVLAASRSLNRVRAIVDEIRSHENPDALRKNGVETLEAEAHFLDPHTLRANGTSVQADKIVIATGSSPYLPPIKGLKETPFLTNETIFDLKEIPPRIIVLGGGPIGSELAQALCRLGSEVSVVHTHDVLLGKEEREAQEVIGHVFAEEGIALYLGYQTQEVVYSDGKFALQIHSTASGKEQTLHAEHLLVSVGRRPNVATLNLSAAGVAFSEKGISVDRYGRTTMSHIFAIGDVLGGPLFTHYAENQARTVLASLLLPFKQKLDSQPIPRVTYTDPEIASIGMSEKQALERYAPSAVAIYRVPFSAVDRALTASRTEGFVKIITKKWSSRILGATIVGPRAGEMLMEIATAMYAKLPLRKLAALIHPYPTYSLAIRKAADLWLTQTILPLLKRKP